MFTAFCQRRKKNKSSKAAAAAALAGERERKVRETPVAAVAKATAWDTVLGHAWEDTGEREQFRCAFAVSAESEFRRSDVTCAAQFARVAGSRRCASRRDAICRISA